MTETCASCAHWKREEHAVGYDLGLGVCDAVPMFWDSTRWNTKGDCREWNEDGLKATAFAQDRGDYLAILHTKPEHFCSMHTKGS